MNSIIEAQLEYKEQSAIEQQRRVNIFTEKSGNPSIIKFMSDESRKKIDNWEYYKLPRII